MRFPALFAAALALSACQPREAQEPASAPAATLAPTAAPAVVRGTVTAVDGPGGMITLRHVAVPALGLDDGVSTFQAEPTLANAVSVGEPVEATLTEANESLLITEVKQLGRGPD